MMHKAAFATMITTVALSVIALSFGVFGSLTHFGVIPSNFLGGLPLPGAITLSLSGGLAFIIAGIAYAAIRRQPPETTSETARLITESPKEEIEVVEDKTWVDLWQEDIETRVEKKRAETKEAETKEVEDESESEELNEEEMMAWIAAQLLESDETEEEKLEETGERRKFTKDGTESRGQVIPKGTTVDALLEKVDDPELKKKWEEARGAYREALRLLKKIEKEGAVRLSEKERALIGKLQNGTFSVHLNDLVSVLKSLKEKVQEEHHLKGIEQDLRKYLHREVSSMYLGSLRFK